MISVSVVVPVYSGEAYLRALAAQIGALRDRWGAGDAPVRLVELILVDDAARDGSPAIVDEIAASMPWVTVIHLSRNFGQHAATIAGILRSSGDWVATLDEDMQHPPERIESLLRRAVETGSDIVYASAGEAVHQKIVRDFGSRFYKRLIEVLTVNPNVRHFNSFRLLRGSIARAAAAAGRHDTYLDVSLSWFTRRVTTVTMILKDVRVIGGGGSGYRLSTLLSHARRMLMSSHVKYIRLGGLFGLAVLLMSGIAGLFLILQKLTFPSTAPVTGWTSMMLTTIFFGGVVAFLLGIALEYLSSLHLNARGMPLFFAVDRSGDRPLKDYFAQRPE